MREKEKCVNFINGAPNSHIQLNNNNKKSTTTYPWDNWGVKGQQLSGTKSPITHPRQAGKSL